MDFQVIDQKGKNMKKYGERINPTSWKKKTHPWEREKSSMSTLYVREAFLGVLGQSGA